MRLMHCKKGIGRGDKYLKGKVVNLDFQGEFTVLTIRYKTVPDKQVKVYH